jgi:two-component system cell cycle response regulator DivK
VDPFRDECDMYAEYFAVCGWSVIVPDDVASALASARTRSPDAVVTRLHHHRADMDGIALTEALKADGATRHIPIIIITSSILPGDHQAALAAGCDACLMLPTTPEELVMRTRRILRAKAR